MPRYGKFARFPESSTPGLIRSFFFWATVLRYSSVRHDRVRLVAKLDETRRESNLFFLIAITTNIPAIPLSYRQQFRRVFHSIFLFFNLFLMSDSIYEVMSSRIYMALPKENATSSIDSENSQRRTKKGTTTQAKSSVSHDDNPRVSMIDAIYGRLFIKWNKRVGEYGAGS